MKTLNAVILAQQQFLVVDNAPDLSAHIKTVLGQIFEMNDLLFSDLKYEYVQATRDDAFAKIQNHTNILISSTFTTIKSEAVEDLINAGIKHNLQNKNIFSLMPFDVVGEDFEYYKPEIAILEKQNVLFYFIKGASIFERYETESIKK